MKREGDGATPRGAFRVLACLYRRDRAPLRSAAVAVAAVRPLTGWCDAPGDRNYNRRVTLPYPASAERLWREDRLYDVIGILDYNMLPRRRGCGSAIFLHVARPGYEPTEGCIALAPQHLLSVVRLVRPGTRLIVL